MELLDDSPRPAGSALGEGLRRRARDITRGRDPLLKGPGNRTLIWGESAYQIPKVLTPRFGHGTPSDTYLALGPRAYFRAVGDDRVLVWRELFGSPGGASMRLSLFDTRALSPVGKKHAMLWRFEAGDMVIWKSGLLAEADVPVEPTTGRRPLVVPREFRITDEVLMLGFRLDEGRRPNGLVLFAVHPREDEVEVVLADWWKRRRTWRSVARVARDPVSRNLVADGPGVKPFLLTPDGRWLGWLGAEKARSRSAARVTATP